MNSNQFSLPNIEVASPVCIARIHRIDNRFQGHTQMSKIKNPVITTIMTNWVVMSSKYRLHLDGLGKGTCTR